MITEFTYCDNPEAEVPKMFIDKEVGGRDEDGNPNIDGSLFMKELMCLSDQLGKKTIEVWINSPGGIVTEGMKIYTAMLESKATVNTYCFGMAASIAGVIFQAGNNRCMLDFSSLMYHNPYQDDGDKDKGLEAIRQQIVTMIATRTGKDADTIAKVMNKETWILADEALENGFCDTVKPSDARNRKKITVGLDVRAKWLAANNVYNRLTEKPKTTTMKTVLNKLGLNEEATETAALEALDKIETLNKKTMDELQKKYDALHAELEKCKEEIKKAKAKAEEEAECKAYEEVKNLVAAGKIKNDAATIAIYKNLAIEKPEAFKAIVDTMPINKTAPVFAATVKTMDAKNAAHTEAITMGLKVGSAAYYNNLKLHELKKR